MPPFQYETYRNPYGPSIAQALAHQGDIQAAGALQAGDLQADATRQRGALQAQMLGTVGQALTAIPAQQRANRALALKEQQQQQEMALNKLQLDEAQRKQGALQRVGSFYDSLRDEQGNVDLGKFQSGVGGSDLPYALPMIENAAQAQGRLQDQAAKRRSALQNAAGGLLQSGDTSPASIGQLLDLGRQTGVISEADYGRHTAALADPTKGKQILQQLIGPQKLEFHKEDEAGYNPITHEVEVKGTPMLTYRPATNMAGPKGEPLLIGSDGNFYNAAHEREMDVRIAKPPGQESARDQDLNAYALSIGKPNAAALTYADRQTFDANAEKIKASAAFQQHINERQYDNANQPPEKPKKQADLEQQYRAVLTRGLSSRSGGLGLEDAKVQQANHLLSLLEGDFDPESSTYNIPKIQQAELATGLARLISPGGTVGVQMQEKIDQATAKGDLAGVLTYLTGQPVNATPQALAQMYKSMIERQAQTAMQNREGEMAYLRGLAPTELDESRRQQLEATSLNPLRQSRVTRDPATGRAVLETSLDNGRTWSRAGGGAPGATTANPFAGPSSANPFRR